MQSPPQFWFKHMVLEQGGREGKLTNFTKVKFHKGENRLGSNNIYIHDQLFKRKRTEVKEDQKWFIEILVKHVTPS